MSDRARQFMAFAALKGYYDLIEKKNEQYDIEDKKELSNEEIEQISNTIKELEIGSIISVIYYNKTRYEKVTGALTDINPERHTLRIIKTDIKFEDILEIIA